MADLNNNQDDQDDLDSLWDPGFVDLLDLKLTPLTVQHLDTLLYLSLVLDYQDHF